jgi:hypothetical protein
LVEWPIILRYSLATFQTTIPTNGQSDNGPLKEDVQEIVTFVDEGVIPSAIALPDLTDLSKGYLNSVISETRDHTIIDFLSRPIIIHQGTWATTDARAAQLYTANFPESLVSIAMYQEKLTGFVGLRATLCIRVQVNSQPFQQGRLMLQYYPYAQYMTNRAALVNMSLSGRSGCPRTDLDLSVGTECDLCIPYVSPHLYYNLVTGQGSFGSIYLVVYSPLLDLSSTTGIEYTVWAHLEDISLQYPTGAPIYTGSTPNRFHLIEKLFSAKTNEEAAKDILDMPPMGEPDTIYAQTELEFLDKHASPSAGVGQIADGLNTLSYIPIIGNLFTKPAWITTQLANLLRLFGFSKPTVAGMVSEMRNRTAPRMANFDGIDMSHRLALASDNSIETIPGMAGTSIDEMAISKVVSIPNYWDNFSWTPSAAAGVILWETNVTPYFIKPYSSTVTDRYVCTHLGYVAQVFGLWRGSIIYTFKFVKTKFHSGRVIISFIPFFFTTSTGSPNVMKCYKMVVDLRTSTEVSFTVPYVSTRPWMFVASPNDTYITDNLWNVSTGLLRVQVLNELRAVEAVTQSIDVIVETSGGPDMTFANPSLPKYIPSSYAITATVPKKVDAHVSKLEEISRLKAKIKNQTSSLPKVLHHKDGTEEYEDCVGLSGSKETECNVQNDKKFHDLLDSESHLLIATNNLYKDTTKVVEPQGVGVDEAIPRNDAQTGRFPVGIDHNAITSNWSPEAFCIGEKIFSLRQLVKRFYHRATTSLNATASGAIIIIPHIPTRPAQSLTSVEAWGYYDYFYYIYAFYRGGMRIKIAVDYTNLETNRYNSLFWVGSVVKMYSSFSKTFETLITRLTASTSFATSTSRTGLGVEGASELYVYSNQEGMVEFEVPYYNVSHITQCSFSNTPPRFTSQEVLRGAEPPVLVTVYPTTSVSSGASDLGYIFRARYTSYRAPADDFSFMYLVGTPVLIERP